MRYDDIGRLAKRVRGIPLEEILRELGAVPDGYDKAKWNTSQGNISISGAKFRNWNLNAGGGGAIDLVMHLEQIGFKQAVAWLCDRLQTPEALEPQAPSRSSAFIRPPEAAGRRHRMIQYLASQRALGLPLLHRLIHRATLYADRRGNAVFIMHDAEGTAIGAELRGTTAAQWRGMARGSRKALGYFSIGSRSDQAAVICESAIDVVSCRMIFPEATCISTAGINPEPAWLTRVMQGYCSIYCGFDADRAGNEAARVMISRHQNIKRLSPRTKDWNEDLKSPRASFRAL